MYLSYHLGTSGHRVASLYGFVPTTAYPVMYQPAMAPPPPFFQPPMFPPPPAPQQAPVTGGISAVLEYDPASMSAFVCWCVFGMLNQNRTPSKEFEASVVAILNATRLPKVTILVALEYTNQRFANALREALSDQDMYLVIVVGLLLANKFNDDNTFTNKSWSSASGIKIAQLNTEEALWLAAVNWKLNVVKFLPEIETLEECWKTWLQKYTFQSYPQGTPQYYSMPSSPAYKDPVYGYTSPTAASPIRYDWAPMPNYNYNVQPNPYAPMPQPSIWAYGTQGQYSDQYYGYMNPYYNNCLASC